MNDNSLRLSQKSLQVLRLIASGHSYAQIVDSNADLNYHDIFSAAKEAVRLDEKRGKAEAESGHPKIRKSGVSAMERAKEKYSEAYEPWTESLDDEVKLMHAAGKSSAEIAKGLDRQPTAIRSRLRKLGLKRP